jgi:hypothetical protein
MNNTETTYLKSITPDSLVHDTIDGVGIVSIISFIDVFFADVKDHWKNLTYDAISAAVTAWCDVHNADYYSCPNEDFSLPAASNQAKNNNKSFVLVENLS